MMPQMLAMRAYLDLFDDFTTHERHHVLMANPSQMRKISQEAGIIFTSRLTSSFHLRLCPMMEFAAMVNEDLRTRIRNNGFQLGTIKPLCVILH